MANTGDISLPLAMMDETAKRLESTGDELQHEIEQHIRIADSVAWELPQSMREQEQTLQTHFNNYLQQMLAARHSIARIVRGAAESGRQLDRSAHQALDPYQ